MSKSLHLEHKFTDRAGREVYEIFTAEDDKRMIRPLGTLRIPPVEDALVRTLCVIDWLVEKTEDDCAPDPEQLELNLNSPPDER